MKRTLFAALLAATSLSSPAFAGPIETACNRSDRPQASRQLCRCIDAVADRTLTRSEQRRAASFFTNPDEAQAVRMSRTRADNEFWERYRAFGDLASQMCGG
ncbi:MAG: hypothetical protein R3D60_00515 [Paracoccaceae bacterium]